MLATGNPPVASMDVMQLSALLQDKGPDAVFLLDVREPSETDLCVIPGAVLVPLGQVPQSVSSIPSDRPVVIYCHHGGRSARATAYLQAQGYGNVCNLEGGIDAWSRLVDPEVPRY